MCKDQSAARTFNAAGFKLAATGGNLTAWRKDIANGRYILVTDSEGCSHELSSSHAANASLPDCYLVGLHADADCVDSAEAATAADAVAIAETFAARSSGNVGRTIAFIQSHSQFATETADGLLAIGQVSWMAANAADHGIPADDTWFEEPYVFPIVDGNVSLSAVRDWLGY